MAPQDQQFILTDGSDVICSQSRDLKNLAPCNHEEADTRIMVHIADAYKQGYTKILVRTVDTDVVVIAVALLEHINLEELWVECGVGKYFRYVYQCMRLLLPLVHTSRLPSLYFIPSLAVTQSHSFII